MNNTLKYKEFIGDAHYSSSDNTFYGKLLGVNDLVTYEADSVEGLQDAFRESVDGYIDYCTTRGKDYFRSFKGSFNVRIPPILHQQAFLKAQEEGISLNSFVKRALQEKLQ